MIAVIFGIRTSYFRASQHQYRKHKFKYSILSISLQPESSLILDSIKLMLQLFQLKNHLIYATENLTDFHTTISPKSRVERGSILILPHVLYVHILLVLEGKKCRTWFISLLQSPIGNTIDFGTFDCVCVGISILRINELRILLK